MNKQSQIERGRGMAGWAQAVFSGMRRAGKALFFGRAGGRKPPNGEAVVLMHGVLNKPFVMKKIARALEKEGYRVFNRGYASREGTVEDASAALAADLLPLAGFPRVHFVGFSLGSIILRHLLSRTPPPNAGRFVQIAPPNHGSPAVDRLSEFRWFRWIYGDKAIQQLRASNEAFFRTLGAPTVPFGIIAGGRGNARGFSPLLDGDNDGSVPVESARLEGAADFILLPHEHTWLLAKDETARQTVFFLKNGRFKRKK